jgi:hypothetical protein
MEVSPMATATTTLTDEQIQREVQDELPVQPGSTTVKAARTYLAGASPLASQCTSAN